MKLRTEVRLWERTGVHYAAVKTGDIAAALDHDAMAAHALLQALGEYGATFVTMMITERAAEILASWGVEQEVAG